MALVAGVAGEAARRSAHTWDEARGVIAQATALRQRALRLAREDREAHRVASDAHFWRALAYVGFFLNLFNLLPIVPLDGGRAMAAVSPWLWLVGLAALAPLVVLFPDPILVLIIVFGLIDSWHRWKARKTPEGRAYFDIPGRTRALVAVTYLALAAALVAGMSDTFLDRPV